MDHLPVTLFLVLVACAIYYKRFYRVSLSQIRGPRPASYLLGERLCLVLSNLAFLNGRL